MTRRKAGRPKGSRTRQRGSSLAHPSRCDHCASTDRAPYKERPWIRWQTGLTKDGLEFNRVVRRATRCLCCGAPRYDFVHELTAGGVSWETQRRGKNQRG